jgi:poly-gamma-glutamate synthase PgsB/CapB
MPGLTLILVLAVLLVLLGCAEYLLHRRRLARIPVRVHVNGTRGKSSVTRLVAAGLRAGGVRTCAKTTGTLARMILPDGTEYPVFRPARPNVIEQVRIVGAAASVGAQALVVECMALQPSLQWLSEARLVRATHGVITNARADHLDVMGPEERDVAWALAGTTPCAGVLYTGERRHIAVFEHAARDRRSRLVQVTAADVDAVRDDELACFRYVEHRENVALALRVCADLGVDRATALAGMWAAHPDPGVTTAYEVDFFARRISFVSAFAANDPESSERLWNLALVRCPDVQHRIVIFNCRADRPDRSRQLGQACVAWRPADRYVLIGTGTYILARAAVKAGMDAMRFIHAEERRVDEIFEIVIGACGASALVVGMGNVGGQGLDVVRYFRNRSRNTKEAFG